MNAVRRMTLKEININVTNALIVGVIIAKRSWRKFASITKNERAVLSFTLRGSPMDCINVTCWGSTQYIQTIYNSYHVGDVVNIIKPEIRARSPGDRNESFVPHVNSPFMLLLNEGQSVIQFHDGDDINTFTALLNIPTKKITRTYSLNDIQTNGPGMRGQHADILVGVRTVGPIKTLKSKNTHEELQARDIIIMDQSNAGVSITLWNEDDILGASHWIPRTTVLFITDVRIELRNNAPKIILTSQTVITINPNDQLATALYEYMKNTAPAPITLRSFATPNIQQPNPQFIRNIISIAQLNRKIETYNANPDMEVNFTALIYCFIVDIDIDPNKIIILKCGICKAKIDPKCGICFNLECPAGSGTEFIGPVKQFDILLQLADHTGDIKNVHLQEQYAEKILEYTPNDFENISTDCRNKIKYDLVLELAEIKLMLTRRNVGTNGKIQVDILTYDNNLEDRGEIAQKLPLF